MRKRRGTAEYKPKYESYQELLKETKCAVKDLISEDRNTVMLQRKYYEQIDMKKRLR